MRWCVIFNNPEDIIFYIVGLLTKYFAFKGVHITALYAKTYML